MRLSFNLSALWILFATAASQSVSPPQLEHIYTGTIVTAPFDPASLIVSPYGHRLVGAGYIGGNVTKPDGTLVANVYPNVGGDSGVQDNNGILHVDTRMTWKFVDDNSYGFMHAIGVGKAFVDDDMYIEFETASPNHQDLNDKYIIAHGTFDGPIWTINFFGLTSQ